MKNTIRLDGKELMNIIYESVISTLVGKSRDDIPNNIYEAKLGGFNYSNRGDEFYTQENSIVKELSNYNLKGKIIYCNCDNPSMSSFYRFFKTNFVQLGLKGLFATYYDDNPKMYFFNGSREISQPISSGRFQDNAEIMKRCDIVITNPPFSDSMASQLIKMANYLGKNVIIIGPNTIANQKEMFELIKNGRLNMGYTSVNRFRTPDGIQRNAPTSWWTTMETDKPFFKTGIRYNPSNYWKYDNFDAIDILDYRQIPDDYYGYMGVSPKFLRVLNRDQFEIVAKIRPRINGRVGFQKYIIKRKGNHQNIAESIADTAFEKFIDIINENTIPIDCGEFSKFSQLRPDYSSYTYFGNCVNSVGIFGDATAMAQFVNGCTIIKTEYVINKLNNGDRRLPRELINEINNLLQKGEINNQELIVSGIDTYQRILFIYLTKTDKHYFFDCN